MVFINESAIDSFIEKYENEKDYLNDLSLMLNSQPDLEAFLDQENYSLLTTNELSLLEYLCTIIYYSCASVSNNSIIFHGKVIEKWEEQNWDAFNASKANNFTKIIDVFFEKYPQEDLLALVEDSIQSDEENIVSSVGSEIIFVACKSLIDTLHQQN